MVSEPLDRDRADRLDRALDALVRGEPSPSPVDPSLRPLLSLIGGIAHRRRSFSTSARQRIWQRIETAPQAEGVPAGLVRERSPIMATMPRPFGERVEPPVRRVRRWRPALELTVVALLLLVLIGGVLVQRPSRTPSVPGLITSPQATAGPTNFRYDLNLKLQVMSRTEPTASPVLLDAERDVIGKRIEALGFTDYTITEGPNALTVQIKQVNLPATFIATVLTQMGEFEVIDTQGNDLAPGSTVNTVFNPTATGTAGQVYPTLASSSEVADVIVPTGPNGIAAGVMVKLSDAAEGFLTATVHSNGGARFAFVLDNRVVGSEYFPAATPNVDIILGALPSNYGLGTPTQIPAASIPLMPLNELVAVLSSGPLPAPMKVINQVPVPSRVASPAVASPVRKTGTPASQQHETSATPYELDLVLHIGSGNQPVDAKTLDKVMQVLTRRAAALGLTVDQANAFGPDTIHIQLMHVDLPAEFVEAVLTQTGLFEIIDPQGKIVDPGTAVYQFRLGGAG